MRIAILGGGFTGLSAAYYANQKGHEVALFEKELVLGGLAAGFKNKGWDWSLERAYHHWFKNDHSILDFAKEIGFEGIDFYSPETSSLYEVPRAVNSERRTVNYKVLPLDTPLDLLRFPLLNMPTKLRAGFVLAFLKVSPYLTMYEKQTAREFLEKSMGEEAWKVLWQELFRKKFGKYAGNILASFIWARVTKRTKELGYPRGGFQKLIDHTESVLNKQQVNLRKSNSVASITKKGKQFKIDYLTEEGKSASEIFDAVISTMPSPIMGRVTSDIFPRSYLERFQKLKFLHAVNLVLETKEPILDKTYWLSICVPDFPMMVVVQHTNMIDKKHYGGRHIAYIARYVERDDPWVTMKQSDLLKLCIPYLQKLTTHYSLSTTNYFVFKGPFAQPIFDKDFLKYKPDFETPAKNFFIANLDMTYPYDRGTNYAVALGKKVVEYL